MVKKARPRRTTKTRKKPRGRREREKRKIKRGKRKETEGEVEGEDRLMGGERMEERKKWWKEPLRIR